MPEPNPFDRSTYGAQAQQAQSAEAVLAAHVQSCKEQALMLLAFVEVLETKLSRPEALQLASAVWRTS